MENSVLLLFLFSHWVVSNSFVTPMDCSPPGFFVCGIFQARILEWVAIPFSRGSSWPRDWTCVSCLAGGFFITEPPDDGKHYGSLQSLKYIDLGTEDQNAWGKNWLNYIHNNQNVETMKMFTNRKKWVNKICYIHSIEYLAIKRNEALIYVYSIDESQKHYATWMKLKQKTTYCMIIPSVWIMQNRHIHRSRKQINGSRDTGEEGLGSDC